MLVVINFIIILFAGPRSTPGRVPLPGMMDGLLTPSAGMDTPMRTRGLQHLRQRIEEELVKHPGSCVASDNTSPGLARLRNTPGGLDHKSGGSL